MNERKGEAGHSEVGNQKTSTFAKATADRSEPYFAGKKHIDNRIMRYHYICQMDWDYPVGAKLLGQPRGFSLFMGKP